MSVRGAHATPARPGLAPEAAAALDRLRREPGRALLESDGLALLDALGIATPRRILVRDAGEIRALADPPLPGERVVLKALSPKIAHKTEAGAVRILPNRRDAIVAAAEGMEVALASQDLRGFLLCEFVPHESGPGREFLLGFRWTREFGPIVTLGPGGIHAEALAAAMRPGESLAVLSPALSHAEDVLAALDRHACARLATRPARGRPAPLPREALHGAIELFACLAAAACPEPFAEFEANPVVVSEGRLVALDALARRGAPCAHAEPRPIEKIARLLEPRSILIAGVSEAMNPGRIILQNLLRAGFERGRITVVKPGAESIDGCRCVPSLDALEQPVDLAVLAVAAHAATAMVSEIADRDLAESVILIPGGLDEKPEAAPLVERMRRSLAAARGRESRGPVVNGGNCLGVRSRSGRVDTLFIPPHKQAGSDAPPRPLALVTGSGAFAISKASKLGGLNPAYTITIGNQMDLTVGDYLEFFADERRIEVFGVYLEGFREQDGWRALAAARRITERGGTVVLYLAGRTKAGADAAASHTAAVAGDHAVACALARQAGVVLAESLEDFEDLVRLFTLLRARPLRGRALGAVSNAGYECVAIADRLGPMTLAAYAPETRARLAAILASARLGELVAVRNPIDLTPILGDEGTAAIARVVLEDPHVDLGIVGCVPHTSALETLAADASHGEDTTRERALASRLVKLWRETSKPWVVVVDAGPQYDAMVRVLERGGVPVFRTADRAMRLLGTWTAARTSRERLRTLVRVG